MLNRDMVSFVCNVCARRNDVEHFTTEAATCLCGSNVRTRALIHLLSEELFDASMPLPDFPRLKAVRALGMSDKEGYASILASKLDYKNTFYEREPRFDFTQSHPQLHGMYDFILSADVIEHIAPPIERALEETARLLKSNGFLGITVYCNPSDQLREHFPNLHTYRTVSLGSTVVLINRRADGELEIRDDIVFHGGTGETLEMREFGITSLKEKLLAAGFSDVRFLSEDVPQWGILFDADVSQPLIARKQPYSLSRAACRELLDSIHVSASEVDAAREECARLLAENRSLRAQIGMAGESRWVKLGRRLNVGPDFGSGTR